ncbi:MAG TPA: AmmeMemoRadiSam system radical SAM enzyme [Candidatus Krumholzibacteria bacterium]|nr:AmmeMemoRadiSam system radical SAM enzyme [Candidatus Krumholzibacteria bacterium]
MAKTEDKGANGLATTLQRFTVAGAPELCTPLPDQWVRCWSCGHACKIPPGRPGICQVRFNEAGTLRVPSGYVAALMCDPIEKKPFFHALPGTEALSFGMLGCDLHCAYCQNWVTSQALRDPAAVAPARPMSAAELVELAGRHGATTLASTYNEPLITSEWAVEVFRLAKAQGLVTAYISNGNATPQVLQYLRPWVDLYKVDLKSFRDRNYRSLGGRLDRILATIPLLVEMGFWVEVVTLVIPGWNDSDAELADIARYLVQISPDIPWHVTAFHQDYKMTDRSNTPVATLLRACERGRDAGLHHVYAGNLPGRVGAWENTHCPGCGLAVIERYGFQVLRYRLRSGRCSRCDRAIAGVWQAPALVPTVLAT